MKVNFDENLVLCLGHKHCDYNTDKGISSLLDATSTEVTGKTVDGIGSLTKSDSAAIAVSRVLEMEDNEVCNIHDGDKIGCEVIGRLTRSKNKVIINAFEDCHKLIEKFHKVGKYFSKSSKNTNRLN